MLNKLYCMFKKIIISLLVLVAVFLLVVFFRKDLTVSKDEVKAKYSLPNSHFINWHGTEIHYTESGSGFPIVMIHGFGGSNRDFFLLDSLLNDQYRVIRVDLPGFGMSDFPKQNSPDANFVEVYNDYFNFLLDTLHIDSCYVMGNSLGGMMAWNVTLTHPDMVKKLVLFNSAGYDMPEVMKSANADLLRYKLVQMIIKKGIPQFIVKIGATRVFYNSTNMLNEERLQRISAFWNREGNVQHLIAMATSKDYVDEKQIKQITCPSLIVWGKQDKIINVKYADMFHADIKGSEEIIYDSCGHVPMIERPLDVKRDVLKFLQKN